MMSHNWASLLKKRRFLQVHHKVTQKIMLGTSSFYLVRCGYMKYVLYCLSIVFIII